MPDQRGLVDTVASWHRPAGRLCLAITVPRSYKGGGRGTGTPRFLGHPAQTAARVGTCSVLCDAWLVAGTDGKQAGMRSQGWGRCWQAVRAMGLRRSACLFLALALASPVQPAFSQEPQWWEFFPGFGKPDAPRPTAHEERRRQPEPLGDLRPDRTPLRSQAMIDALETAIHHYQTIVTNGGWPTIPGNRAI